MVKALVAKRRTARVVVFLVIDVEPAIQVLLKSAKLVPEGTFVWMGSDGLVSELLTPVTHLFRGGFIIEPTGFLVAFFQQYFRSRTLVCKHKLREIDIYFVPMGDFVWQ